MKTGLKRVLLTCAAAASLGAPALAEEHKATVMHWLTSGSEAAALRVLAGAYAQAGGEWVDQAVPDYETAIALSTSAILNGEPPTAMLVTAGEQFADLADMGYLTDLTPLAEAANWQAVLPADFYASLTRDGKVYAIPTSIQGSNWVWISLPAFKKAGVEVPGSWDELFPALDKLKAAGIVPIAHAGEGWVGLGLFSQVLLLSGHADFYEAIFGQEPDVEIIRSPEFKGIVEQYKRLTDYVDPGAAGRKWNDATGMVIRGEAAMQFQGDWAKAEFIAAGQKPGVDYDCLLGFGGVSKFLMVGDAFAMPANEATTPDTEKLFADVLMSPTTQVAFNAVKGGLPPRLDADISSLDVCSQRGYAALQKPDQYMRSAWMTASADRMGSVQDVIVQYWADPAMTSDQFIDGLVAAVEASN